MYYKITAFFVCVCEHTHNKSIVPRTQRKVTLVMERERILFIYTLGQIDRYSGICSHLLSSSFSKIICRPCFISIIQNVCTLFCSLRPSTHSLIWVFTFGFTISVHVFISYKWQTIKNIFSPWFAFSGCYLVFFVVVIVFSAVLAHCLFLDESSFSCNEISSQSATTEYVRVYGMASVSTTKT